MAGKLAALDRALNRELLVRRALQIQASHDKNTTALLTDLAQDNSISLSTLYRLMDSYRRGGFDGLVRKRTPQPLRSIDPVVIDYVRQILISDPSARGASIINNVVATSQQNGWKTGSRASLYRLLIRLRKELNIEPPYIPSCNRDKLHLYIDQLPPEYLDKVQSYLEYIFAQSAGDQGKEVDNNSTGSVKQPTLNI